MDEISPKPKGGRPKGSTGARGRAIARRINDEFGKRGTSLIAELIDLAMTTKEDRVKAQVLLGISRYVYPQLQSLTVKNEEAPQTAFVLNLGSEVIEVKSGPNGSETGSKLIDAAQDPQVSADRED